MNAHPPLLPLDVAEHWPFIDRQLFRLPKAARRALAALAWQQVHADGQPCSIRQALLDSGVTAGEAGHTSMVLRQLEGQGILWRFPGSGRRPHHWSIRPELSRWRHVSWETSGRDVEALIGACWCRAVLASDARIPGQQIIRFRKARSVELLPRDHYWRPGRFSVDMRASRGARAPLAPVTRAQVVEMRDKRASESTPLTVSGLGRSTSSLEGQEEEGLRTLKTAIERAVPGREIYPGSGAEQKLWAIARDAGDRVDELAGAIGRVKGVLSPVTMVTIAEGLLEEILAPRPTDAPSIESIEHRITRQELERKVRQVSVLERAGEAPDPELLEEIAELRRALGS